MYLLLLILSITAISPSLDIIEATYGSFRTITKQVDRCMKKHGIKGELAIPLWTIKRLNREQSENQNVLDVLYLSEKKHTPKSSH